MIDAMALSPVFSFEPSAQLPRMARRGGAACARVLAVETERNEQRRGIAWQFTSRDARRKLERLYPVKQTSS